VYAEPALCASAAAAGVEDTEVLLNCDEKCYGLFTAGIALTCLILRPSFPFFHGKPKIVVYYANC